MRKARSLALMFFAVVAGCSKSTPKQVETGSTEEPPPPVDAGAVEAAVAPSASASSGAVDAGGSELADIQGQKDPRFMRLTVAQRLVIEKANRPADGLRAEAVLDQLGTATGEKVGRRSQVPAWPWSAMYCAQGYTALAVNVLVCEYGNAAATPKPHANARPPEKGTALVTVRSTTVAISASEKTPEALAQVTKLEGAAKKL